MSSSVLSPATAGELSKRRKSLVLAICCVSIVVVVMDISIVNVALPAMGRDLHAPESGLQWTVDAYTLVLAALLVLAGSAADGSAIAMALFALCGFQAWWCAIPSTHVPSCRRITAT